MTDRESGTANKAGYLFAVIIAAQLIVAAFGLALDRHCRSGDGKEHCVIAADVAAADLQNQPQRYHRIVDVAAASGLVQLWRQHGARYSPAALILRVRCRRLWPYQHLSRLGG